MFIIYDLIFIIFALIYLPIYLWRKKFHPGFSARLGLLSPQPDLNAPIWIHAVSVGEAKAIKGLVEELSRAYPDKKLVISTVTPTGNKIVQGLFKGRAFITYLPLDLGFIVSKVIDRINPSLFIIAETEIWPNIISYLFKKHIPIVVVNGRISDSSFRGYLLIKPILRSILKKITLFCVQGETDKQRLLRLGVAPGKIQVTGNMKFDAQDYSVLKDSFDYRLRLGLKPQEKVLIAASTHPKEEEIVLRVYGKLLLGLPNLRLLIAPRHPERTTAILNLIKKFGFNSVRVSTLNPSASETITRQTIFVLDTVGQLGAFYALADVVFVGGSLVKIGGHNLLEPAALGKPVVSGPHMFNFRDIAELFLKEKALILARNEQQLRENIAELLNNPAKVTALRQNSQAVILRNRGATKRNFELIRKNYVPCRDYP